MAEQTRARPVTGLITLPLLLAGVTGIGCSSSSDTSATDGDGGGTSDLVISRAHDRTHRAVRAAAGADCHGRVDALRYGRDALAWSSLDGAPGRVS